MRFFRRMNLECSVASVMSERSGIEEQIRFTSGDCIIMEENEELEDVLWKVTHWSRAPHLGSDLKSH